MKSQTFDFAGNQKFALGLIPISVLQYVDIDLHTVVFFLALHAEFLLLIWRDNSSTCNFMQSTFKIFEEVYFRFTTPADINSFPIITISSSMFSMINRMLHSSPTLFAYLSVTS